MTAQIISLSDYRTVRSILRWQRVGTRHWSLVDQAGIQWATIEPYGDKRGGRGMFALPTCKATSTNEHLNRARQRDYWVLASTVTQAKNRILTYLRWAAAGVVEFDVAA